MPWWEQWPGRLEAEYFRLQAQGLRFERDDAEFAAGRLTLTIWYPYKGTEIALRARFPDSYPYFPPDVIAESLTLERHQDPFGKQLCLIAQSQDNWRPSEDCLADLITSQLPEVLAIEESGAPENEERVGAPITAFFRYAQDAHLAVPAVPSLPASAGGELRIALRQGTPLRGTVVDVLDEAGQSLAAAEPQLKRVLQEYARPFTGRWVRLQVRPDAPDAKGVFRQALEQAPQLKKSQWQTLPAAGGKGSVKLEVIGLLFDDELAWREAIPNWLFILRTRRQRPRPDGAMSDYALVRAELDSREQLAVRTPELRPLKDKTVVCVGLGSIGSVAAVEFARAGVGRLRLLDRDTLEIGNSVRWALGRSLAGLPKAQALYYHLRENYPYTAIAREDVVMQSLGRIPPSREEDPEGRYLDGNVMGRLLADADLVFDASASAAVNQYVADLARARGIPYVWASATHGAWGGRVGRALSDEGHGCWRCYRYHLSEGTLPRAADRPDEAGIQPAGCLDPTFTGAAVDLAEISMMGVRLAIATLCRGEPNSYPDYPWDYAAVSLREADGRPCAPQWRTRPLKPHPDCDHG